MTFYRRVGDVPPKRHIRYTGADGNRVYEELMGTFGFSGPSALLYHRHSPSAVTDIRPVDDPSHGRDVTANSPVSPLHLRTFDIGDDPDADFVQHRRVLAVNSDITITVAHAGRTSPLYRNATGDELVYFEQGSATFESVFGAVAVQAGDYVVIPAGTTHRWVLDGAVRALVIEASGHVSIPDKYRGPNGQMLEHAPYCERDLHAPAEPLVVEETDVDVLIRTRAGLSTHRQVHHPFDVVGWDGSLYPYTFSIHDFEPIVGRLHQPPPVHQTFAGPGFVVCSFVPRLFDFHPDAVKIPYHHSNVDSDEVLYYVGGDFMSRANSGIGLGSMSIHPAGFTHGPQPGSYEASADADRTEETAVMIDTFSPLLISDVARGIADPDYARSWLA